MNYRLTLIGLLCLNILACDEEWRRMAVAAAAETQRLLSPHGMGGLATSLRPQAATPLAAPLILSPRIPTAITTNAGNPGAPQLLSPAEHHHHAAAAAAAAGLIYTPYADYANYALAGSPLITEYTPADHSGALLFVC